jgi:hypothetical protein
MSNLPLKIGKRNLIVIDKPDRANARRRKIKQSRRPKPTRTNHQHARSRQPRLPHTTHLTKDDVPRVPLKLFIGQGHETV